MSRSVNKVQDVFLSLILVLHLDGMALDGDAAFLLQIHVVKHLAFSDIYGMSVLQQAVSQR